MNRQKLSDTTTAAKTTISKSDDKLFQKSLNHFATGMVRIAKDDMMQTFDFGLPPNVSHAVFRLYPLCLSIILILAFNHM